MTTHGCKTLAQVLKDHDLPRAVTLAEVIMIIVHHYTSFITHLQLCEKMLFFLLGICREIRQCCYSQFF